MRFARPASRDAARAPRGRVKADPEHDIAGLAEISESTIYPHVFSNADREVGGVLVGRIPCGGGRPLLTGAIEAISADEQRATLTFTQDSWEHVHRTLDRDYSEDDQIVGWYHSHPGFGIFLSEHDLFIHRNFFSGVSQIAVVVDPCAGTEGTFVWREGQVDVLFERPTPPAWVAQEDGRDRPPYRISEAAPERARYPIVPLLLAGVVGLGLGAGLWTVLGTGSDDPVAAPSQRTHSSTATTAQPARPGERPPVDRTP